MNGSYSLPSIEVLKKQAKRLRAGLESDGRPVGHARSLELLAHQHGYKDWNTLHAVAGNRPPSIPVMLGQRARGHYLGQAFEGEVIGIQRLNPPGRFRVTFHFDQPVDVATSESFSVLRQRVTCVINADGVTAEKTSNGRPHLQLQV